MDFATASTLLPPATNDDDPRSACLREELRDRRAQPLRAAGDDGDFAADAVHFITS